MLTAPKTPSWSCFVRSSRSLSHGMSAACSVCNPSCLLKEKLSLTTSSFHPTVALSLHLSIGKSLLLIMANHFSLLTMSQKIQQPEIDMTWTVCIWLKWKKWIFSSILHSHKAVGNANPLRWTQFGFNMTIIFVFYLSLRSHKTVGNPPIWKEQALLILIIFSSIFLWSRKTVSNLRC